MPFSATTKKKTNEKHKRTRTICTYCVHRTLTGTHMKFDATFCEKQKRKDKTNTSNPNEVVHIHIVYAFVSPESASFKGLKRMRSRHILNE